MPAQGFDTLVAAAIASIALNPLLFRAVNAIEARARPLAGAVPADRMAEPVAPAEHGVAPPVAITGVGELGQLLARRCADAGVSVCVIDSALAPLEELRRDGIATVFGDPGQRDVLRAAGVAEARMIVVTNASLAEKQRICTAARELSPRLAVVATAASSAERAWLEEFGAAFVCDALARNERGAAAHRSRCAVTGCARPCAPVSGRYAATGSASSRATIPRSAGAGAG